MLQVGDHMPDFKLRDPERNGVTQDDLKGSISVMAFYVLAFTGG